jgi:hypothetical protein
LNPAKEPPFKFSFEDSFGNKGVTFVTPTKTGIIFSATINEEEDPRCLIFYNDVFARVTAAKILRIT